MCDLTRYTDTYASTDGTTHAASEDRTTLSLRVLRLRGPLVSLLLIGPDTTNASQTVSKQ